MSWWKRYTTLEEEETYHRGKYFGGSRLEDIFDLLRTGEYAAGGIILRHRQRKEASAVAQIIGQTPLGQAESVVYGISHRVSPSKALEIEGFWTGLAVDVLLDPTTYLTLGTGGAIKIGARVAPKAAAQLGVREGGKIALKKGGREVLEGLVQSGRYGFDEAQEVLVRWMADHPADATKWMHEGGLRWMGQTVIPGKQFEQAWTKITGLRYVGAPIESGATGIAGVSSAISTKVRRAATGTADVLGEAFVPGYWMKQLPGKYGGYFTDYLDWVLRKRGAMAQGFHELKVMAKPFKDRGEELTRTLESTLPTGDVSFDKYVDEVIRPHLVSIRSAEIARGVSVGDVTGYVPHVLTKQGEKFLKSVGGMPEAYQYYAQKVRAPYAEKRLWEGTVEEINESLGFEFFESNFWKAMAPRTQKHISDIYTADWFKFVQKEYGIDEVTDAARAGVEFVESRHPQIEKLLPTKIAQHLEELVEEPSMGFMARRASEYDWGMTWWKRSVTTGFGLAVHPAFFARNVYSGVYQNWVRTGMYSPVDYYKGVKARLGKGVFETLEHGQIAGTQMQDILREQGILGQPGMMDVILENVWERTTWQKVRDVPSWFMTETENLVRIPEFVKLAETMGIHQARDVTFETHFAYLPEFHTKFEMDVAKRAYPFWTWMSKNLPYQVRRTIEQPRKLGSIAKVQQKLIEHYNMEEEYERRLDWQRNMFLIPNVFKGGEGWIGLGMPFLDLTTDLGDLYFGLSPVKLLPELGYIEQDWGSREYKTKKQLSAIRRLAEGRYGGSARRLVRTEEELDKLMYLAGMPTYDVATADVQSMFAASRWKLPSPTKEQEYAAWIAAGAPEGFRIKTLIAPSGGMVGVAEVTPDPKWWEIWKKPPEKPAPPHFELLALTEDVYERAQGFTPTPSQIRYITTGLTGTFPELNPFESLTQTIFSDVLRRAYELPGSREMRYGEVLAEWERFKAGEFQPEYPTLEQRMDSWRRAGKPNTYTQKIYRNELGKLIGVSTYTLEGLEAMGGFVPSEAQKIWAFRTTRKMLPKDQMKIWASEWNADQLQREEWRKEYAELRADPFGTSISRKGVSATVMMARAGDTIVWRQGRMKELETFIGVGVDR